MRTYGVNLPSSLTTHNSYALVHLHQSTSVGLRYGRPYLLVYPKVNKLEVFPGELIQRIGFQKGHLCIAAHFHSAKLRTLLRIYQKKLTNCLHPKPIKGSHSQFSISIADISGTGILTCCPSVTPFGLTLGPTNPWLTAIAMETLDIQRAGFSPALRYSSRHSHFYTLQQLLSGHLHCVLFAAKRIMYRTLPYHPPANLK